MLQAVIWVIWTVMVRNVPFGLKKPRALDLSHRTLRTKKAKDECIDGTSDKKDNLLTVRAEQSSVGARQQVRIL